MGTWGIKNFENDMAGDFIDTVTRSRKNIIYKKLKAITDYPESDSPDCEEALVVLEMIAAAKGKACKNFPEELSSWMRKNDVLTYKKGWFSKEVDITEIAQKALAKIITTSELVELWKESGELEEWLNVQKNLKSRIG